ncbi:DNA-binding SARP family transcriptional activator/DNA-binding transcriptional LysR family regulator [Amycolatopsis lexingtonensis]|uniref:DNA-binding SARP family transcriptional activator/DNA-binding transcriptional LysR family regulator n=1 Tax=Amycolatopsis lexingtonensis TaxID=218822 RepID=A0ABR9I4D1_9PSEU|nr:BTAD domain-containing putative transcriptional regulator [Amycolatopsis lexingtonensis]MBE1498061.1 DNA-binding SARP family transcriptional activator/DNA-binding transcriptional LysR family regulator [Amycolatopsis lexingtonensis]
MVRYRVLGTLEAESGGALLDVGHVRRRYVLAALLAEPNRPVPLEQLVTRVWGAHPPHRAAATVRSYVSRLRAAGCVIERTAHGYLLRVDLDALDLHRFREKVALARAAAGDVTAAALFDDALALWRGEPFAGLDSPWLTEIRAGLEAERHAARLDRNDVSLRLGRHAALLAKLPRVAADHPFDERLAGQLILAYYRSGRQADALAHFERVRRRLAGSLGADPGPALRELHRRILAGDPELDAPLARAGARTGSLIELAAIRAVATLLIVAREGDFEAAAWRVRSTADALEKEIGELEAEIGGALVVSGEGGVRLTELGERLRAGARAGVAELAAIFTETRMAERRIGGRLRVGYVASLGGDLVTRVTTEFERRHPACRVTLTPTRIGQRWNETDLLAEGDLDLVLHWSPGGDTRSFAQPNLRTGPALLTVPRGLLLRDDHPLAARATVSLEDLADHRLLDPGKALHPVARDLWAPPVTPSGRPIPRTEEDVPQLIGRTRIGAEDMLSLVARGIGLHISVVSLLERYPFPGLRVIPVADIPPMLAVPVWRASEENEAIRAYVSVATELTAG